MNANKLVIGYCRLCLLAVGLLSLSFGSCTRHKREHEATKHELSEKARDEELSVACKYETVYVCVSPTARRYHSNPDCSGLSNCAHHVEEMTVAEAEEMGKTPSRRCNY